MQGLLWIVLEAAYHIYFWPETSIFSVWLFNHCPPQTSFCVFGTFRSLKSPLVNTTIVTTMMFTSHVVQFRLLSFVSNSLTNILRLPCPFTLYCFINPILDKYTICSLCVCILAAKPCLRKLWNRPERHCYLYLEDFLPDQSFQHSLAVRVYFLSQLACYALPAKTFFLQPTHPHSPSFNFMPHFPKVKVN